MCNKKNRDMVRHSAGILMYRLRQGILEVFLVHPGGPYWAKKDEGAWSIPKGEFDIDTEDALEAAKREFKEETGFTIENSPITLDTLKQPGGKVVHGFAVEGDCDAAAIKSNTFLLEWPPHSGKQQEFPEVDRAEWVDIQTAKNKLLKGQAAFIDRLLEKLKN